ncbi:hypothetical protein, partial [Mesomycoplasma ovipneumoniae]|uniref:hypothetical protein n=1 Tax=Mesomycoplasma ovipneumoniae TaxID=29562 RepID=UPI00307FE95F
MGILALFIVAVAWVGHACILTATLNNLYGRSLPKPFLKAWRHSTAIGILAFPLLLATAINPRWFDFVDGSSEIVNGIWGHAVLAYANVCLVFGGVIFPFITVVRLYRTKPACVVSEQTRHFDFWPEHGEA